MQAAGAIAALAMQHAQDKEFMSPYIVEAARQGFDLPFWEKVMTASFEEGSFKLGTLRVCAALLDTPFIVDLANVPLGNELCRSASTAGIMAALHEGECRERLADPKPVMPCMQGGQSGRHHCARSCCCGGGMPQRRKAQSQRL